MPARRVPSLADLTSPELFGELFGPVERVDRAPMGAGGFSGARHERVGVLLRSGERVSLVLKWAGFDQDWTARRTGDLVGREAALLEEPALAGVWDAFASPHRAFAVSEGAVGLLMDDLTAHLFPDVDEPLEEAQEERLLGALAAMHARFWESEALQLPWLARPAAVLTIIGPRIAEDGEPLQPRPPEFAAMIRRGWELALGRVPARVRDLLLTPAEELARGWDPLPRTLVHGDAKVANFALPPDGPMAAFDWVGVGVGPVGRELGYYLAVNAGRLVDGKEAALARYRRLLDARLGAPIAEHVWRGQVDAAVLTGAMTLLWQKAWMVDHRGSGRDHAEWAWWVDRLGTIGA